MIEIWSEKYRPTCLNEVVGHDAKIRTFKDWLDRGDMPNALLYGVPGVGKTALIRAFAMELFGDHFEENFQEINASDDRKLDVIRERVSTYGEYAPDGDHDFKILYLGEMDGLPKLSQDALKRTIETSADVVRFVADCNNLNGLIPAIKSRFCRMHLSPLKPDEIVNFLIQIIEAEGLMDSIDPEHLELIANITKGDLRNSLQILQALPIDGDDITEKFIRDLTPSASRQSVTKLASTVMQKSTYKDREGALMECMYESGFNGYLILEEFYELVWQRDAKDLYLKSQLLSCIGEYMWRTSQPCNQVVQLRCCLTQIQLIMGVS